MSIAFLPLSEVDPAQVRELLVRNAWKRDGSEELAESYVAWRYGAREGGDTLVACDQGRCVGIADLLIRPYWIAGRQEIVRETCDWFCLPEYRALGVGLHLMRRMMAKPEPILVIGGTDDTRNLLPRLKWARLPDVGNYLLRVSARAVAGLAAHKRWRGGIKFARAVPNIPLVRRLPGGGPVGKLRRAFRMLGEAAAMNARRRPMRLRRRSARRCSTGLRARRLCSANSSSSAFTAMASLSAFRSAGWKSFPPAVALRKIVHLHAARLDMIDWMVGTTVQHLVEHGAGAVLSRVSCPATAHALSGLGFWRLKSSPAYWWPAKAMPPTGLLNLTALQADDALQFT